ncbi:MAG: GrpB family protein [Pseudomonadota bacterium]
MAPGKRVQLVPHDPRWAERARDEGNRLADALGPALLAVHHIGSTAIPGILAKPTIDLLPVARSLTALDERRHAIESLGYEWMGEFGLPGRRYCRLTDPETGRRLLHVHCYEEGSPEIARHLAFRDYLRGNPLVAKAYEVEKQRCLALHPENRPAYQGCKDVWIARIEATAMHPRTE